MHAPSPALVRALRPAVTAHIRRTPLLRSGWLSQLSGGEVYLKCENLQVTGSFKVRGAFAALAEEPPEAVVAVSAGNHGQGLALAARTFAIPCTVVVPSTVPEVKAEAIRRYGARLVTSPFPGYDETERWTLEHRDELGGRFVSPYDDPAVVAGNGGTTGLEILEDAPPLDAIVVPCGGGGCAAGIGLVTRETSPGTRIVAVNTDASPGMWLSRRDGRAHLHVEGTATICEGLEGGVSESAFHRAEDYVHDVVLAREATIRRAVAELLWHEHMVVEGSGAAGVAALLDAAVEAGGRRVCVVLTGSNIDPDRLRELLG
jgi:threonine dehydratase